MIKKIARIPSRIIKRISKMVSFTIQKMKRRHRQNRCYTEREYSGYAAMGCCAGIWGGDYYTGYLDYSCVACQYYTSIHNPASTYEHLKGVQKDE
jgi:hypothetical protein